MEESVEERRIRIRKLRSTPIEDVIAEQRLIAWIGGERTEIVLQIGRPYTVEDGEARTPVASWGLDGRSDLCGDGTFQSLNIACHFLEMRIVDEAESGVKFYYPEHEDQEIAREHLYALFATGRRHVGVCPRAEELYKENSAEIE